MSSNLICCLALGIRNDTHWKALWKLKCEGAPHPSSFQVKLYQRLGYFTWKGETTSS